MGFGLDLHRGFDVRGVKDEKVHADLLATVRNSLAGLVGTDQ